MEGYIGFFYKGKCLARISLKGYFFGELRATRELIAFENGIKVEEIIWKPVYIENGKELVYSTPSCSNKLNTGEKQNGI